MNKQIIFFAVITLINVILSTTKSVLTVSASKGTATVINAISYGFYTMVVKQMATVGMIEVVTITVLANIVGVYFSLWLLEKLKKPKTWKISVALDNISPYSLARELEKEGIGYNVIKADTKYNNKLIEIFTDTKEESKKVKNLLKGNYKYNITELAHKL